QPAPLKTALNELAQHPVPPRHPWPAEPPCCLHFDPLRKGLSPRATLKEAIMRTLRSLLLIALLAAIGGMASAAEENDQAALGRALQGAKASLQGGLQASEREGQPISGKFEIEDGKLQLSVYTMKNGGFMEVVLDPMTGAIAKSEKITEG